MRNFSFWRNCSCRIAGWHGISSISNSMYLSTIIHSTYDVNTSEQLRCIMYQVTSRLHSLDVAYIYDSPECTGTGIKWPQWRETERYKCAPALGSSFTIHLAELHATMSNMLDVRGVSHVSYIPNTVDDCVVCLCTKCEQPTNKK